MSENQIVETSLSQSERFAAMVEKEFQSNNGEIVITAFQRKLSQNYFIAIDQTLKASEIKRLAKNEQYREPTPYTWGNINTIKLAVDVMAFSSIGLDPCQPNHLSIIPYKNKHTGKYDLNFTVGYVGLELKAMKYGFDIPSEVITEVVYSNDSFKQHKRNRNNEVESYDFDVINDFDRGEIIGGFYYLAYSDPKKNRIRVFNMKDIEKRIPKNAATEFWGGEKDVWLNGKKTGEKEEIEGWKDEMVSKTLKRAAFNSIPIDSAKIDENLMRVIQAEKSMDIEGDVKYKIESNANTTPLDFEEAKIEEPEQAFKQVPAPTPEPIKIQTPEPVKVSENTPVDLFAGANAAEAFPAQPPF